MGKKCPECGKYKFKKWKSDWSPKVSEAVEFRHKGWRCSNCGYYRRKKVESCPDPSD